MYQEISCTVDLQLLVYVLFCCLCKFSTDSLIFATETAAFYHMYSSVKAFL